MQRKQFGKRGVQQSVPQFGDRNTSYASAGMPAYASAGGGAATFEDDDNFSIGKMLGLAFGMLFSFRGRLGRMEYWVIGSIRFVLFIAVLIAFVFAVGPHMSGLSEEQANIALMKYAFGTAKGGVMTFLLLTLTLCQWSLEARRCHDRDSSALYLLILFIPIVGSLYAIYLFIVNGFFPGTLGPNRFDTVRSQAQIFD
ncbi:DUF805 domain-containing protein [Roseibium album]|uniref:Inner membrane protein YhaH n=1 Tax=Roseibium album TaxID=311410 RepID=A0A0M6ZP45_9HYPH|nr:DUF805 domain-containing protein [Roseibium album]CTQ61100.1 Inner membrane protein YhaH [Roseibium album]CTQ63946.1 Inner membrane protein YhaH [Roseibium album]CTQ72417.1 Inner membrane protein YhaH [Roseibium album]